MKRYDSYKDSGVQWIGEIPRHWSLLRGKFSTKVISGFPFDSNKFTYEEDNMPLIRIRDIDNTTTEVFYNGAYPSEALVNNGDVLVGMDGEFNVAKWKGKKGLLNQRVCKLEDTKELSLDYLYYLISFPLKCINDVTYATTVKHLSVNDIYNSVFPIPPITEQKAIAEWIDVKCGEIDKLIATQQRRIDLLQELRQSIITRAVTRGINPDAPLRDSGIDWIGQVPSHWEISKMNYVCDVITDYVASGSFADLKVNVTYLDEPDYAMLVRTADLSQKNKDVAKVYVSKQSYDFLSNSNLFGGEIILPNIGASIGDVYMVPIDLYDKMTLAPNSIMVKTKWCDLFYFYYFKSVCGRKSLELIGQAAAQGKFNKTELRQLRLPLPPLSEQREIVAHIKHETAKVDHALQQAERQIELLQELRQSVITEVVTGKRKVC